MCARLSETCLLDLMYCPRSVYHYISLQYVCIIRTTYRMEITLLVRLLRPPVSDEQCVTQYLTNVTIHDAGVIWHH